MLRKINTPLKAGLLIGIFLSIWDSLNYTFLYTTHIANIAPYIGLLILIVGVYFGIRNIKKFKFSNEITFGQASLSGVLISIYAALVIAFTTYIFYSKFNDTFEKNYLIKVEEKMKEDKVKPEEMTSAMEQIKKSLTPANQGQAAFFGTLITGIVFSFIFALVHRNKTNSPVEQ